MTVPSPGATAWLRVASRCISDFDDTDDSKSIAEQWGVSEQAILDLWNAERVQVVKWEGYTAADIRRERTRRDLNAGIRHHREGAVYVRECRNGFERLTFHDTDPCTDEHVPTNGGGS